MRTRKVIDGNLVFFGVKGVIQNKVINFTCGDDKICGADYDEGDVHMSPIHVYESGNTRYPESVFVDDDKESYADGIDGVNQGLMQRLALIQGELSHFLNAGFPLLDKKSSKAIYDSYVVNVVSRHPDVTAITKLTSSVENNTYRCSLNISTTYGKSSINFAESV